jgi:glycosyltransferase involved in cell wall biosynthesis
MKVAVAIAAYTEGTTGEFVARALQTLGHQATILTSEQFYQAFATNTYDLYFCVDSPMPLNLMQPEIAAKPMTNLCFWFLDYSTGWRRKIPSDLETARLIQARGGWVFQTQTEDVQHCLDNGITRCSWLPLATDSPTYVHRVEQALATLHQEQQRAIVNLNPLYSASVVVPWWDHTELLSYWEQNLIHLQDAEVIFVDNGSAPEGKKALEQFCERYSVKLIRNEQNRGFAAANNQGAGAATGDYIIFMNNDVEVLKPPVQSLCHAAGENMAGPGPMVTDMGDIFVEGWALCIKKSTLKAIGGWCEDYGPGYWDDVDLCCRAILGGYQLNPLPNFLSGNWQVSTSDDPSPVWINHIGKTTGEDGRLDSRFLDRRNRALFEHKFYPQLRQINLVIFPDWTSSDEVLCGDLVPILQFLSTHPERTSISLMIDSSEYAEDDIEMLLSGIVMYLSMEIGQDWSPEIEIGILTRFNQIYWEPWKNRLHARIILPHEHKEAIHQRASSLPAYTIAEFSQKTILQQETGRWKLV